MEVYEIAYNTVDTVDTNLISRFPNICAYSQDNSFDMLLIHRFQKEDGTYDYIVIGKFKENMSPSSEDFSYIRFLKLLNELLSGDGNYRLFLEHLRALKESPVMDRIEFTQEGYDLLTGKYLFEKESIIQRTVEIETFDKSGELMFGRSYYPVNKENKMTHIGLFDEWAEYDEKYFLNRKDLERLDPNHNKALLFAVINKDRLFLFMDKYYHSWFMKYKEEIRSVTPDEVARFSLQILDVAINFQLEDILAMSTGQKK